MTLHIERIELQNYRSCKRTAFQPNPRLTTLIGVNGSGKSNILNGILLLKKIATLQRGYHEDLPILSGCKIRVWFSIDGKTLPFESVLAFTTDDRNADEVVDAQPRWNIAEFTGRKKWLSLPMSLLSERFRYQQLTFFGEEKSDESRLRMLYRRGIEPVGVDKESLLEAIKILRRPFEFISEISYYGASQFTDPSRCPTSFEVEDDKSFRRRVGSRTTEHAKFMYDLYSAYKADKDAFSEFMSIVGPSGVGLVDEIQYDEIVVPSNTYQVFTGGRVVTKEVKKLLIIPSLVVRGTRLSPNQLSEGSFKTLAILFYLVTDQSRLLLLEEPEVCVHHGLLSSVVEIIKSFSARKQILISTHSDFVLDKLEPENVFLVSNDSENGTKVKPVPKSMSKREYAALKNYLSESGNLGEYWRHGGLDKS